MDELSEMTTSPRKSKSPMRASISKPEHSSENSSAIEKMSLRMEIELKRDKLKSQEEANFTYKPVMYTSRRLSTTDNGNDRENRFDKLYSDALKRQITSIIKEEEAVKSIPFSPKLSTKTRSSSRSRGESPSGSRSNTPTRQKLEPPSFTFKPDISKRAKSIERPNSTPEISDRLYLNSEYARQKLQKKRSEKDLKDMEECTFSPKILDEKRSHSATRGMRLVDRLTSYGENTKHKIAEKQKVKEEKEAAQLTFRPSLVTKRSPTPTTPSNSAITVPVYERLSMSTEKPLKPHVREALSEFTFKPHLVSRSVSPNSRQIDSGISIHDRLFVDGELKRIELENERQQKRSEMENELTFRPQITSYKSQTPSEEVPVFERLTADKSGVKDKLDKIKSEIMQDWTFAPTLTDVTLKLTEKTREGDTTDIYTRQVAMTKKVHEEAEKKKVEQEEEALREATFSPKLPTSSLNLVKRRAFSASNDGMQSVNTDVYSRLSSTGGGNRLSPTLTFDAMSFAESAAESSIHPPNGHKVVLNEKALDEVFKRLNSQPIHHVDAEHVPVKEEDKKKVLVKASKDVEHIVSRLNIARTASFSFKINPEEAEQLQDLGLKDSVRMSSNEVAQIVERLHGSSTATLAPFDPVKREVVLAVQASNPTSPRRMSSMSSFRVPQDAPSSPTARVFSAGFTSPEPTSPVSTPAQTTAPETPIFETQGLPIPASTPSVASPTPAAPPVPPTTAYKPSDSASKSLNVDDFQRKLEESLRFMNDTNQAMTSESTPAPTPIPVAPAQPTPVESVGEAPKQLQPTLSTDSVSTTGSKKVGRIVKPSAISTEAVNNTTNANNNSKPAKKIPNANVTNSASAKKPASTARSSTPSRSSSTASTSATTASSSASKAQPRTPSTATKTKPTTTTTTTTTTAKTPTTASKAAPKSTPLKGTAKKAAEMSPLPKEVEEFINSIPMVDNYDDDSTVSGGGGRHHHRR